MSDTLLVALVFVILLGFEWRYRRKILRLVAVVLALVVWWFVQPSITTAARRASAVPADERVRVLRGDTLSEYMSGVDIMREYVVEHFDADAGTRRVVLSVLVWLACTPVFRRETGSGQVPPPA